MQKITLLIIAALVASTSFAQEKSESVDSILKELGDHQGVETASAPAVEPVVEPIVELTPAPSTPSSQSSATEELPIVAEGHESAVALAKEEDLVEPAEVGEAAPIVEEISPVAEAMEDVDVEELIADSRDFYVGGEFARAQAGFEKVIQLKPENMIARMYLRKLTERDQRTVEVSSMKAVTAAWNTDLVIRSYAISDDAVEKMGLTDAEGAVDVEVKFPEVAFKKGASAVYQPAMEKLFVRNTRDNLLIIEEILEAMDVAKLSSDVEQVEIEAKFVEVSEGTLEELGFEWRSIAGNEYRLANDVTLPGGQALFDDGLRGGTSPLAPMPFSRPNELGAKSTPVNSRDQNWSAFRFEDTFSESPDTLHLHYNNGSTPLDVIISALDQSSGADVLSAPRIVTKSGETATIRVGELHTYPEIYEASASAGNIVHVKYEDWEEMLLGVELEVTPQVDGDQIELGLNPKFRELQGWQNYDIAPANSAYTHVQEDIGMTFRHDPIVARLPIYRVREIDTEVTISDGATIVMGGLTSEKVEAFEDRVPLLGSMPLVGRLFRNEGERAIKRNLMMFVTAKIVEPTGRISSSRSFE